MSDWRAIRWSGKYLNQRLSIPVRRSKDNADCDNEGNTYGTNIPLFFASFDIWIPCIYTLIHHIYHMLSAKRHSCSFINFRYKLQPSDKSWYKVAQFCFSEKKKIKFWCCLQIMVMATCLRRHGRRLGVSIWKKREFSTSCEGKAIQQQLQSDSGKSLNLYSAINQALHIALDTDPRYIHNNTHIVFSSCDSCLFLNFDLQA